MSYRYLLFDLDHTLLDFDQAERVAMTEMLRDMGISDIEGFLASYHPVNQELWRRLERGEIDKKELVNTRFSLAFNAYGRQVDGKKIAERYESYIARQGQLLPGAKNLLTLLKEKGFTLVAVTNGITVIQEGRLKVSGLGDLFDQVFISEKLHTQKPDPAFFKEVEMRIPGFDAQKALMIGDSLTSDIKGGMNVGWDTAWYNPKGKALPTFYAPTYVVKDYRELCQLLGVEGLTSIHP